MGYESATGHHDMTDSIEVKGLTKRFGHIQAVSDVSFTIRRGELFGLLGPNGAGKTTTINMLVGLARAALLHRANESRVENLLGDRATWKPFLKEGKEIHRVRSRSDKPSALLRSPTVRR
jgi:ABC-type glutathione transport system ATPase component